MGFAIVRRQGVNYDDGNGDDGDDSWGYSNTAVAIKWAFIGAVFLLFLLWFVGGYYHAQRRIKRGLPPLRYHRFLLPARQRQMYMRRSQFGGYYPQHNGYGEGYAMQAYPPPPPAYHTENIPPPSYQPPQGGTKVNPTQEWAVPPPGPPPGYAGEGSSTMQSVPLNPASIGQQNLASEAPKKPGMMARLNPFK